MVDVARRMGRPPLVNREALIRAALEIGFVQLSMSAVGKHVGASHSTLYRYFASRDELASAAIDRALDAVAWPRAHGDWRTYLSDLAWSYWDLYTLHPGLATEVSSLRSTSRGLVELTNDVAVTLLTLGFTPQQAVLAQDMIGELVTHAFLGAPHLDNDHQATAGQPQSNVVNDARQRRTELINPWLARYDKRIRTELATATARDPREHFAAKLTVLLDGLAASQRSA